MRPAGRGTPGSGRTRSVPSVTLVIAHRGASAAHPPGNTLAAFAASGPLGADGVELDVHLSADGVVVVHHDPVLADGRVIGDLTVDELPDHIPSLDEAIDACGALTVNIEIKPDGPERLRARLIEEAVGVAAARDEPFRWLFTSFDHSIVDAVRLLAPESSTGLLTMDAGAVGTVVERAAAGGHDAVAVWYPFLDADVIGSAHSLGLHVIAWTVDDPERMARLIDDGVDAIITNLPDVGRAVVNDD